MAAAGVLLVVSAAVVAALVGPARACGGYSIEQSTIKPCPGITNTNGLSFQDIKAELTSDCKIRSNGCVITEKTLPTAKINYIAKRDGMIVTKAENKDGCKFLDDHKDDESMKPVVHTFQIPTKCPLPAGKVCGDGKTVDIGPYKDKLAMFGGSYTSRVELDNGDAGTGCYDMVFKLQPKTLFG